VRMLTHVFVGFGVSGWYICTLVGSHGLFVDLYFFLQNPSDGLANLEVQHSKRLYMEFNTVSSIAAYKGILTNTKGILSCSKLYWKGLLW